MPNELNLFGGGEGGKGGKVPQWLLLGGVAVVVIYFIIKNQSSGAVDTSGALASEYNQRLQDLYDQTNAALQDAKQGTSINPQPNPTRFIGPPITSIGDEAAIMQANLTAFQSQIKHVPPDQTPPQPPFPKTPPAPAAPPVPFKKRGGTSYGNNMSNTYAGLGYTGLNSGVNAEQGAGISTLVNQGLNDTAMTVHRKAVLQHEALMAGQSVPKMPVAKTPAQTGAQAHQQQVKAREKTKAIAAGVTTTTVSKLKPPISKPKPATVTVYPKVRAI